jgi:hypothetical protein
MTVPDAAVIGRLALLGESSVTSLLLPQAGLPSLASAPIFAYEYPRKVTGAPLTGYTGHDWVNLLKNRAIEMVLVTVSGRVNSSADTTRSPWGRVRLDVQTYGRTYLSAAAVHWAIFDYFKNLHRERVTLSGGTALIHDLTVEGGPISFPDPETDGCPVMVGMYAATVAEEYVA